MSTPQEKELALVALLRRRIKELEQALSDMWTQAANDCPEEYRTAHFRTACTNAIKVLNKKEQS